MSEREESEGGRRERGEYGRGKEDFLRVRREEGDKGRKREVKRS